MSELVKENSDIPVHPDPDHVLTTGTETAAIIRPQPLPYVLTVTNPEE